VPLGRAFAPPIHQRHHKVGLTSPALLSQPQLFKSISCPHPSSKWILPARCPAAYQACVLMSGAKFPAGALVANRTEPRACFQPSSMAAECVMPRDNRQAILEPFIPFSFCIRYSKLAQICLIVQIQLDCSPQDHRRLNNGRMARSQRSLTPHQGDSSLFFLCNTRSKQAKHILA
jgi:hypothetical protein